MFTQNWKLLSLNLTGNRIGDDGANSFARVNQIIIHFILKNNLFCSGITL